MPRTSASRVPEGPPSPRALAVARLRRIRALVLAGVTVATAGLTAAVSSVVPGRSAHGAPQVKAPDPFVEPLVAYPPGSLSAPVPTDEAPIVVSGPS